MDVEDPDVAARSNSHRVVVGFIKSVHHGFIASLCDCQSSRSGVSDASSLVHVLDVLKGPSLAGVSTVTSLHS